MSAATITMTSLGIVANITKHIKSHVLDNRIKKGSYFVFSVHAKMYGVDDGKDLYLLGSEYDNKNYKPIGGVIKSRAIMEDLKENLHVSHSNLKPRNVSAGELAFEIDKHKIRPAALFVNSYKQLIKRVGDQLTIADLLSNLIREFKEEFGVILSPDDFEESIEYSVEKRQFLGKNQRYHIHFILNLKNNKIVLKKIKNNKKGKIIFSKFKRENSDESISDLVLIFNNTIQK